MCSDDFDGIPIWLEKNEHGELVWVADGGYRSNGFADESEARAALADKAVSLFRHEEQNGKKFLHCILPKNWVYIDFVSETQQKYDHARMRRAGARAAAKMNERLFDCINNGETQ